jgi:ribonuclease P protein subunit POP4
VLPLHQRWRQYLTTLLAGAAAAARPPGPAATAAQQLSGAAGPAGTPAKAALLLQADMHGCLLRVVESGEPRWQGLEGIVVRDTQETFIVVTKDSRVVTLPKRRCTFEYSLGQGRVVRLGGVVEAPPRRPRKK